MSEKNSKIKSITYVSTYNSQHGEIFYHNIELENGDKGQIGAKEKLPQKLSIGNLLWYTIELSPKGNKIKAIRPLENTEPQSQINTAQQRAPYSKSDVDIASFAMAYTKDLIVGGKVDIIEMPETFERIFSLIKSKQS